MPVRPHLPARAGHAGNDHCAEEKTGFAGEGGYPQRPAQRATGLVDGLVQRLVEQAEVFGDAP